ncbi:MAG TPA: hypothetical protein VNZ64_24590 [Candidatus Acidoferrum sp.]|nr:hypothetical protein [Candidatus Acidoferrum sp.]
MNPRLFLRLRPATALVVAAECPLLCLARNGLAAVGGVGSTNTAFGFI